MQGGIDASRGLCSVLCGDPPRACCGYRLIDRWIYDRLVTDKRTRNHGRDSVRVTGHFHGVTAGGVGEWEQHARTRLCGDAHELLTYLCLTFSVSLTLDTFVCENYPTNQFKLSKQTTLTSKAPSAILCSLALLTHLLTQFRLLYYSDRVKSFTVKAPG